MKNSSPRAAAKPPAAAHVSATASATTVAPEPDLDAALASVLELMAIAGPSRQEGPVRQHVERQLLAAGARPEWLHMDRAHRASPGEVGNLILRLPGTRRGPRRLLMAHLDTVPLCVGCQPVLEKSRQSPRGIVRSADPATALGADNRAGTAVLLAAARALLTQGLEHPPATFLWTVQEEIGLCGAQNADLALLGRPKLAFNWDGGPPEKITVGATGAYRFQITITGLASHAGNAPEKGVSAIAIAALAIARLHEQGWHGLVERGSRRGTSNVGVIAGGEMTNVVAPQATVRAECRSHDPKFRLQIARAIERAFTQAAGDVKSAAGERGRVAIQRQLDYESFLLDSREPCVLAAEAAVASVGLTPFRAVSNGGLDANGLSARGIPTVTMGCGQQNVHTTSERLDVAMFEGACRVALRLATGFAG